MKAFLNRLILVTGLFVLAFVLIGASNNTGGSKTDSKLGKTTVQEWKNFDVNTIQCVINSAGPYCDYLKTNSSGLYWPKGSGKTAVFTAGIWVVGVHRPTSTLRTAVQDYQTEFQPGPILGTFNTSTNKAVAGVDVGDPADQRYHIYKIIKKDSVGGNPDYDNWPGDLGAPYIDVDHDGKWTPGVDKPKLWGDQQLWCVYNDANSTNHAKTGTTQPMGIEIQTTYFGFNQPGALGNIMFMRWKIINKSDADYDSVFISMWSDTDLGGANDDYVGVDIPRKLGYVYNATNNDAMYGDKPPADGFVFFQGPRIKNSDSTGLFEGQKIKGFYNNPATSHVMYINGDPKYGDPPLGNPLFPDAAYGYLNGFIGATQQPFIDPTTNKSTKFVMSGDPVTGTGWTMDKSFPGGKDVRSMISSGPFTLAKGDTQEIVGGFVIAQGGDRLNSVEVLRRYTDVAQESFNVNFALPSPPPAPTVIVGDLSNQIVLNWGDPSQHSATENYNFKGAAKNYKFEGYNIYQLGEPSSATSIYKRLATYDLDDSVKTELDGVLDNATGILLQVPVCFGTNSGVKRYFVIDKDYITNGPLVNGKEYYFSVAAYAFNFDPLGAPSGIPKVLEDSKEPITVIPRQVPVGDVLGGTVNQGLLTNRGMNGDDAVNVKIINPRQLNGATYEITFNGVGDTVKSWNLKRKGVGPDQTLVSGSTNLTGANPLPIFDGLMFSVAQPEAGIRRDPQSPRGYSYSPSKNVWFKGQTDGVTMQAFSSGLAYPMATNYVLAGTRIKPSELQKVEIRFSNTQTQKAYRYVDNIATFPPKPIFDSSFIPYIIRKGSGILYQDFVDVPFTAWEVDSLDGSYAPRQLNVGFVERNDSLYHYDTTFYGRGRVDGKWKPTIADNGGEEVVYIFKSTYGATPLSMYTKDPGDTSKYLDIKRYQDSTDLMYVMYVKASDSLATFKEGDKFTIMPNYAFTPSSMYSLIAPKNTVGSTQVMKSAIEKINVFPNPYFGNNSAESSIYQRWVTFTNLPEEATIRIFTLTGELVSTINHKNKTGYERWYLRNNSGLPVASGMYIAYIEIKDVGTRLLKIAIIQPEERPSKI